MRLTDGKDVHTNSRNYMMLSLQPGRIANPQLPSSGIGTGCWTGNTSFTNTEQSQNQKKLPKGPKRTNAKRGRPSTGPWLRAPCLSLCTRFLGEDRLNAGHLVSEHGGHLLSLEIHLNLHLLLKRLHLGSILLMVFMDRRFQTSLAGSQV